eukprot:gene6120-12388_t
MKSTQTSHASTSPQNDEIVNNFPGNAPKKNQTLYRDYKSSSSTATRLCLPNTGHPFKILNPFKNFGFKKAFHNPIVLMDFLNHILDYQGIHRIVEVRSMDKEYPNLAALGRRDFRVDIICKTDNNRYFIVELLNDSGYCYLTDSEFIDKVYVEFTSFSSSIEAEKTRQLQHQQLMRDRKRRRIECKAQTDVDVDVVVEYSSKDFWGKIDEVLTLMITSKGLLYDSDAMEGKVNYSNSNEPPMIESEEEFFRNKRNRNRETETGTGELYIGNIEKDLAEGEADGEAFVIRFDALPHL